ncbi:MAG: FAD-dependent oxidoreductase [Theionarchaea archaeon]|nr:FAD-dependent oxidoreductase [Theionarchaea archaeon]
MELVIIGLGTAGYAAAMEAARHGAHTTIVEKRDFETFSPCGLPYVIDDTIPDFEDLKHTIRVRNAEKLLSHEAESIDTDKKTVSVKNMKTGEQDELSYDKLILATGTLPLIPPIEGARELLGEGTYVVSGIDDTRQLKEKAQSSQKVVVIGAGAIGLETACTLHNRGVSVTVLEMLPQVFPQAIDADIASEVATHLESAGISVHVNSRVEAIKKSNEGLVVVSDQEYHCDCALIAAGVRANTAIAEKSGIAKGRWGIAVNEKMETSHPDVYACGDCIETFSYINGKPWMMQLATSALQMGQISAINATGGEAAYDGCLNTFASDLEGNEVASTGFTEQVARQFGYEPVVGKGVGLDTADYYPGGRSVRVKLVIDTKNHTLLGGQAFGSGAFWRVNVIAMALKARMTVEQFSTMELAYTPPLSPSYDALQKACDFALRRL